MEKKISVIISARDEFSNIVHTVHSILNDLGSFLKPEEIEIILVDNGSVDRRTWEFIAARGLYSHGTVRIVFDPIFGNVSARNKGVALATGKYIFFSDAHMSYPPGTFKKLIQAIDDFGGIVHPAVQWMGGWLPSIPSYQYSLKIGEKLWGCVDEKTEVLTMDGWKKRTEVMKGQLIPTLNLATKSVEIQPVLEMTEWDYDGHLIGVEKLAEQWVTPDHRCVVLNGDKMTIQLAKELTHASVIPLRWNGEVSHEKGKPELYRVVGWFISEGCVEWHGKSQRVSIIQKTKRVELENDLKKAGMTFSTSEKGNGCARYRLTVEASKTILNISGKELLPSVLHCTHEERVALYEGLMSGDGQGNLFSQANEKTVDMVQMLLALIGFTSRKSVKNYTGAKMYGRFSERPLFTVNRREKSSFSPRLGIIEYKGKVWCPTVGNGTIFIRRAGVVSVTGQTWNRLVVGDGTKPYYIPVSGHCCLGMLRKQFIEFGGYNPFFRCYGGGELYLDLKWWMKGSNVVCVPDAVVYHLSAGRGYSYNMDDLIHNMILLGAALGAPALAERVYLRYLSKKGAREDTVSRLNEEALEEAKKENLGELKYSLYELLTARPWDTLNDKLHGKHNSGMLIYDNTWTDTLSSDAKEIFDTSPLQKDLSKHINDEWRAFVYKGRATD